MDTLSEPAGTMIPGDTKAAEAVSMANPVFLAMTAADNRSGCMAVRLHVAEAQVRQPKFAGLRDVRRLIVIPGGGWAQPKPSGSTMSARTTAVCLAQTPMAIVAVWPVAGARDSRSATVVKVPHSPCANGRSQGDAGSLTARPRPATVSKAAAGVQAVNSAAVHRLAVRSPALRRVLPAPGEIRMAV
jgi:hypothetical protein